MTTTPRGPAPRAAPLLGSLAVHAVLIALAAALPATYVAAGDGAADDDSPTVLAWIARPQPRHDEVVATPPAERRTQVPAPRHEFAEFIPVAYEEPVTPPRVEASPAPR